MENLDASWKSGIGASLYSTAVGSVGMGARLLVDESLEEVLLLLLVFELNCEDEDIFVDTFTTELEEGFAEVVELAFVLVEDGLAEDFEEDFTEMLVEEGLTEDLEDDFAEVLVLVFLVVEEGLMEALEEVLAAS
jgi:hypothetical protein